MITDTGVYSSAVVCGSHIPHELFKVIRCDIGDVLVGIEENNLPTLIQLLEPCLISCVLNRCGSARPAKCTFVMFQLYHTSPPTTQFPTTSQLEWPRIYSNKGNSVRYKNNNNMMCIHKQTNSVESLCCAKT